MTLKERLKYLRSELNVWNKTLDNDSEAIDEWERSEINSIRDSLNADIELIEYYLNKSKIYFISCFLVIVLVVLSYLYIFEWSQ